jgi:hypothetical protein
MWNECPHLDYTSVVLTRFYMKAVLLVKRARLTSPLEACGLQMGAVLE